MEKMKDQIKLPYDINILIKSRYHNSLAISVFQTNKNIMSFLLNYYIDVVYNSSATWQYDFLLKNPWFTNEGLVESNHLLFFNEAVKYKSINIIEIIKNLICESYYVRGDYNTYYIPTKKSYLKVDHNTEYLICGYNDNQEIFYVLVRTVKDEFDCFELSYSDYMLAITNRKDNKFNLDFFRINDNFKGEILPSIIIKSLYNYLNSITLEKEKTEGKIYGVDCFKKFLLYVRKMSEIYDNIDIRYAKFFVEHKNFMQMRMHCLYDLEIIKNMDIIQDFDDIYTEALTVYNLINEYNEKHDYKDVVSIDLMISDINKREKNALKVVIDLMNHNIEEARTNTK